MKRNDDYSLMEVIGGSSLMEVIGGSSLMFFTEPLRDFQRSWE